MWTSDELADALFDMGSALVDTDDGSGDNWIAADMVFDMAESITSGAPLEDVTAIREEGLEDVDPNDFDEDDIEDVFNESRFNPDQAWGLVAEGYGELGIFDTDDLIEATLEQGELGEMSSEWSEGWYL